MIEVLQPAETASFRDEGYVAVARPVIPLDGLVEVGRMFDDLQSRIHELPPENVHDLGVPTSAATTIPEVIFTTQLEPGLFDTSVYETCRVAASELLGGPAVLTFDHLIVKPAHSEATTQWHQDQSYDLEADPGSANFWIPLTAVSADMSCMRFIPRSHLSSQLLEHRKSGVDALEAIGVDDSTPRGVPAPARWLHRAHAANAPLEWPQRHRHCSAGLDHQVHPRSPTRHRAPRPRPRLGPPTPLRLTARPRRAHPVGGLPGGPPPNHVGSSASTPASWGARRSRSERTGSVTGQGNASCGSSHAIARSRRGAWGASMW